MKDVIKNVVISTFAAIVAGIVIAVRTKSFLFTLISVGGVFFIALFYLEKQTTADISEKKYEATKPKTLVKQFSTKVNKVASLIDGCSDLEVKNQLSKLAATLGDISGILKEEPERIRSLDRVMNTHTNHVLDVIIKVISNYQIMGKYEILDIDKITGYLDTINSGFTEAFKGFFDDTILDIKTDMSVTLNLMKRIADIKKGEKS